MKFYLLLQTILALCLAHQEFHDENLSASDQMDNLQATNLEKELEAKSQMPWIQQLMKKYPLIEKVGYSIAQGGLEYFLIVAVVLFAFNYMFGIRRNIAISQKWLEDVKQVIFLNFAIIGTGDEAKNIHHAEDIIFEDSDSNIYPLYASGRENLLYAFLKLELKKRQDFISMIISIFTCRKIFKSPIAQDSLWLELPLDRASKKRNGHSKGNPDSNNSQDLVTEILIVPKEGYYLEQIKSNMPHIDKLLKVRYPNLPCNQLFKSKTYPLLFLSETQESMDLFFNDNRIQDFFTRRDFECFWQNIYTIHMTDQRYYSKFDYEIRAQVGITVPSTFKEKKTKKLDDSQNVKSYQAQMLRSILYIADHMNNMTMKYQDINLIQQRRKKIYEQMKRTTEKKDK